MVYGWVFKHDYDKEVKVVKEVPAPVSPMTEGNGEVGIADSAVSTGFSLLYFLKTVGKNVLNHLQWKQLVAFAKKEGLARHEICERLNNHYEPPDLQENGRLYDSIGDFRVGKGSIVRMLTQLNVSFDERLMFPGPDYKFHNESIMFDTVDKVWTRDEILKFFVDVYGYTWGGGITEFIYREKRDRRFGKEYYTTVNTIITSMPFSRHETDKLVLVEPSLKDLPGRSQNASFQSQEKY